LRCLYFVGLIVSKRRLHVSASCVGTNLLCLSECACYSHLCVIKWNTNDLACARAIGHARLIMLHARCGDRSLRDGNCQSTGRAQCNDTGSSEQLAPIPERDNVRRICLLQMRRVSDLFGCFMSVSDSTVLRQLLVVVFFVC
jgi:hypothetical protein